MAVPLVLSLVGAGPGCSICRRRQGHALLVHSFGLRAHDEAEEVLIWYSGPSDRRRGRGTALVIQTGALAKLEKGREHQFEIRLWTLELLVHLFLRALYLVLSGTWHLTSISKKSSSGSALSALAIRWLSTAWLLF